MENDWIDEDQPITKALLDFMNQALMYGPLHGVIIPKSWFDSLREENPEWNLNPNTRVLSLNSIMVKVDPSPANQLYAETIDSVEKWFDIFRS